MDDPSIGEDDFCCALRELELINRTLGGYRPTLAGIAALLPEELSDVTLLDVGCGGGDVTREAVRWARRRKLRLRVRAIDISPPAVEYTRRESRAFPEIQPELENIFDLPAVPSHDVVHASLVMHHFRGGDAAGALRRMYDLARLGVVINDLHRHPFAYHSIRGLTGLFSRSRLIRNDAPLSVLRAFVRDEWNQLAADAGLPRPEIRWRWAFRWQVVLRK